MKILVTGASGFIGSFIVEEGLQKGMQVWAGMRSTSSKKYLKNPDVRFAELDFNHPERLKKQLEQCKKEFSGWDYIVHAAGATKCLHREDFFYTNTTGTQNFVEALQALDMVPRMFVFVSSLSVYGAIRETPAPIDNRKSSWIYAPIQETDTPCPNTAYGESKLKAEQFLKSQIGFPCIILRPTGVYGPRETDYFLMAKSIKQHIDFAVGYKPQEITFVYVKDLVQLVYKALEKGVAGRSYFVSDGQVYNSRAFSDLIQKEMGNPPVLHIKAPLWFLRGVCAASQLINGWLNKASALNGDKYHILSQRNWQCDITSACNELDYQPQYPLERGVKEAIAWYRKEGWL